MTAPIHCGSPTRSKLRSPNMALAACKAIHFFEGELRLIAECLRCAGPQKVAKQPPGSTHGVATREEIEKYLKQLKRMQTAA